MGCYCGQINISMMMNPYINPFLGMSMGVGMFGNPNISMSGVPYCSMIPNSGYNNAINPYAGMNSIFAGNFGYNPFIMYGMAPVLSIANLAQQIFDTGNRLGETLGNGDGSHSGLFTTVGNTPAQAMMPRIPMPSFSFPRLGSLTSGKTNSEPTNSTAQNSSGPSGKSRPAAGKKLGKDFLNAVKAAADRINCDYRDLLAVMNGESGLNPQAVNKKSGATGLIQFMPKTAAGLGTTTDALKNMSAIEQLKYVEKYLVKTKKSAGFADDARLSAGDLYSLVFLPARAKREILCERGEGNNYYEWNSGTDINKDGKITKSELSQRVYNRRVDESIFA